MLHIPENSPRYEVYWKQIGPYRQFETVKKQFISTCWESNYASSRIKRVACSLQWLSYAFILLLLE